MPGIPELSPAQFRDRWPQAPRDASEVTLLDVREPAELELAAVDGVLHIPMRDVPTRLAELDRDKPLVVMCHSGGRSRRVAEFLVANGFDQIFNLTGGIDAWSQQVDAQVPRY
jgi:rhodanese-related sulfurtransferase